jgi:S-adenosylmethionine uptake transporter
MTQSNPSSQAARGLACMVTASLLFSMMSVCVYAVGVYEPQLPAPVVSFVRVLVNLFILVAPAARHPLRLFGDLRPSLWLRGLFGTLALLLSFASIQLVGPGESSFLGAGSGVFVALLGPFVLKQKNSPLVWLAIAGAMTGLGLLFHPRLDDGGDWQGRAMALGGGFLSALAYLMVARAGRSNSPETVIFYFCLVAVLVHLAYFAFFGFRAPTGADIWLLLLVGGTAASGAQYYMTRAYQTAPAALVSAVGYLNPVLSLGWGALLFAKYPDAAGLWGCALVLLCGVTLPFLSKRAR